jgi:hypothetical protein
MAHTSEQSTQFPSIEDTSKIHARAYSNTVAYYEALKDSFIDTRRSILERVLGGLPKDNTHILDVGSGIGANLAIMHETLVRFPVVPHPIYLENGGYDIVTELLYLGLFTCCGC